MNDPNDSGLRFGKIHNPLMSRRKAFGSAGERQVYLLLELKAGSTRLAKVDRNWLCRRTGYPGRSISRYLKRLTKEGFISNGRDGIQVHVEWPEDNWFKAYEAILLHPEWQDWQKHLLCFILTQYQKNSNFGHVYAVNLSGKNKESIERNCYVPRSRKRDDRFCKIKGFISDLEDAGILKLRHSATGASPALYKFDESPLAAIQEIIERPAMPTLVTGEEGQSEGSEDRVRGDVTVRGDQMLATENTTVRGAKYHGEGSDEDRVRGGEGQSEGRSDAENTTVRGAKYHGEGTKKTRRPKEEEKTLRPIKIHPPIEPPQAAHTHSLAEGECKHSPGDAAELRSAPPPDDLALSITKGIAPDRETEETKSEEAKNPQPCSDEVISLVSEKEAVPSLGDEEMKLADLTKKRLRSFLTTEVTESEIVAVLDEPTEAEESEAFAKPATVAAPPPVRQTPDGRPLPGFHASKALLEDVMASKSANRDLLMRALAIPCEVQPFAACAADLKGAKGAKFASSDVSTVLLDADGNEPEDEEAAQSFSEPNEEPTVPQSSLVIDEAQRDTYQRSLRRNLKGLPAAEAGRFANLICRVEALLARDPASYWVSTNRLVDQWIPRLVSLLRDAEESVNYEWTVTSLIAALYDREQFNALQSRSWGKYLSKTFEGRFVKVLGERLARAVRYV